MPAVYTHDCLGLSSPLVRGATIFTIKNEDMKFENSDFEHGAEQHTQL